MSASRGASAGAAQEDQLRLRGSWLALARGAWLTAAAAILILWVLNLPATFADYLSPCARECALSVGSAQALTHLGIPLAVYAWIAVGAIGLLMLVSTVLAIILFWRRSDDWMALLVAAFLLINASWVTPGYDASAPAVTDRLPWWLVLALGLPVAGIYYAMFLLFPGRRFAPRWSWLFLCLWLCLFVPVQLDLIRFLWPVGPGLGFVFGAAIAFQIYRYRRVSTPLERQQTKWAVFGLTVSQAVSFLVIGSTTLTPLGETLYLPVIFLVYVGATLVVPITFFIAIQRYRLYDIDPIINKALVYGALSAILAIVYIGGVIGLQSLARTTTRQDSPFAVVASTLLIVGLFQPLRSRLQKTLAAFSATLRQEVSLTELHAHLLAMVEQTMQPASVSLWLAPPRRGVAPTPNAALAPSTQEGDHV